MWRIRKWAETLCIELLWAERSYFANFIETRAVAHIHAVYLMALLLPFLVQIMPTILIAEDNLDARDAISELLQANGFTVLLACDGEEVLEILESHKPDLILTDIDMPHIDGLTLCMQIKNNPHTSDIPLILISGRPPIYQPNAVFDVIQKPILTDELLASLKAAIRHSPVVC